MILKREARVMGFDDGPVKRGEDERKRNKSLKPRLSDERECILAGVIMRGKEYVDRILTAKITVDGTDATEKILELAQKPKHKGRLRAIFLNGISFAGFNLADIKRISEVTHIPVIAAMKNPNALKFKAVASKFPDADVRRKIIENAGEIHALKIGKNTTYFQCAGISPKDAETLLRNSIVRATVPEAVRIAHLVAGALAGGESKGRV